MDSRKSVWVLSGVWLLFVVASVLHAGMTRPTGDGFVRGLNILEIFLVWQMAALILAVAVFIVRLAAAQTLGRFLRIVGLIPITITVLFWGGVAAYIAYA